MRNGLGLSLAWMLALSGLGASETPSDNPVAAYYSGPEGYPAWTRRIAWDRVLNMATYPHGRTAFEKFELARDELAAQGGGVLYYPAGEYRFEEGPFDGPQGRGLMLKSGVVIRGATPEGKPQAFQAGQLELKTKFIFGFQKRRTQLAGQPVEVTVPRDWNLIGLQPGPGASLKEVHYVGLCWVHLDGAVLYWGPELKWGPTWKEAKGWKSAYAKEAWAERKPDGTHPADPLLGAPGLKDGGQYLGAGRGRLLFGCVFERAALLNDYETCGRPESPAGFGPEGFHMAKFAARAGVYGACVFLANNSLPKCAQGNFLYEQTTVRTAPGPGGGNTFKILGTRPNTVMWDYGRTMGMDVNKDLIGLAQQSFLAHGSGGYFEEGVVVQDNWVWNHGHKGYNLAGQWAIFRQNRNERIFLQGGEALYGLGANWCLTLDGFIESCAGGGGMISDNLSRAFDLAGRNLWIAGNTYLNTGSAPGHDGEGILCQLHGGSHVWSWALTHNTNEGTRGNGRGYLGGYNVDCLGMLLAWNQTPSWVGTRYRKPNQIADLAFSQNTGAVLPGPEDAAHLKSDGTGVPLYSFAGGALVPPKDVKAEVYAPDAIQISWVDAGENEMGYRVDRQRGTGAWTPIAYRPPQREKHPRNPPVWVDFLAPAGEPLQYRVVAIQADDSAEGAAAPVSIQLP